MRTIPVDLILHSLLDLLRAVPADTPGTYAEVIALCIDHRRVVEEWQTDGDPAQAADWLRRRLDARRDTVIGKDLVCKDTRTIEVAIARRLADVAFALCIEQTVEATAHATTLLRAAQAIVGLSTDREIRAGNEAFEMIGALATALQNPGSTPIVKHAEAIVNDLRTWRSWAACWATYPDAPTDKLRNTDDDGLRLAIAKRIEDAYDDRHTTELLRNLLVKFTTPRN